MLRYFFLVFCFLGLGSAIADEASVRKILEARMEGIAIQSVQKMPYIGLYEVRAGADIFYTDEEVTHIFVGNVLDGRTLENLTEVRSRKFNAIAFDKLPLNQAIALVRGKGSRKLAYFADPLCSYCRRLDRAFQEMDDVTIYVFVYPILSPNSMTLARGVWCSANPAKAWTDFMLNGVQPKPKNNCTSAEIDRNLEIGQQHRILVTPTLVFENGWRVEGAVPPARLDKLLNEAAQTGAKPAAQ
ncbi:MAG TPA: DsbC family protein [Burkholderiales bacterium]|nr:DsbC family protein [Burkholderiales bacterium]